MMPPVTANSSCNDTGSMAARIPCSNRFAVAMSRAGRGAVISMPRARSVEINSSRVIFVPPLVYSRPRLVAIWAAIWDRRSSVALPPSPPPPVCAGMYIFFAGAGSHTVS